LIVNINTIKGFRSHGRRVEYKMRALSEVLPFTVFPSILLSDMGFFKNTPNELLLEWLIFYLQWPDFNL
jgi:hypothetical protein